MALMARRQALRRVFVVLRNQAISEYNSSWNVYFNVQLLEVIIALLIKVHIFSCFCFSLLVCVVSNGWLGLY
jgi:hypothetical protein